MIVPGGYIVCFSRMIFTRRGIVLINLFSSVSYDEEIKLIILLDSCI